MQTSNQVCTYDFTIPLEIVIYDDKGEPCDFKDLTVEEVTNWLNEIAKSWTFQLERGELTGFEHYQGRLSLKMKRRLQWMKTNCKPWDGIHWSVTSSMNMGNAFYVMKEETRIGGPWRDDDPEDLTPDHLTEVFKHPYPYQDKIEQSLGLFNEREVNVLLEPKGCQGKSSLAVYLCARGKIEVIPPVESYEKVVAAVCSICWDKKADKQKKKQPLGFFFDMPRGLNKEKLRQLYSAIETIKSGLVFDTRYSYHKVIFKRPPIVWVFTNFPPDKELLTPDRWKVWTLDSSMDLVPEVQLEVKPSPEIQAFLEKKKDNDPQEALFKHFQEKIKREACEPKEVIVSYDEKGAMGMGHHDELKVVNLIPQISLVGNAPWEKAENTLPRYLPASALSGADGSDSTGSGSPRSFVATCALPSVAGLANVH